VQYRVKGMIGACSTALVNELKRERRIGLEARIVDVIGRVLAANLTVKVPRGYVSCITGR